MFTDIIIFTGWVWSRMFDWRGSRDVLGKWRQSGTTLDHDKNEERNHHQVCD